MIARVARFGKSPGSRNDSLDGWAEKRTSTGLLRESPKLIDEAVNSCRLDIQTHDHLARHSRTTNCLVEQLNLQHSLARAVHTAAVNTDPAIRRTLRARPKYDLTHIVRTGGETCKTVRQLRHRRFSAVERCRASKHSVCRGDLDEDVVRIHVHDAQF